MAPGEEVVRATLEQWKRGDWEPGPSEVHPDVEIVSHLAQRSLHGYGGIRRWIGDMRRSFDLWEVEIDDVLDGGDGRWLAVGRRRLHGRRTGTALDEPCAWLIDVEDGLIVRVEAFVNRVDEAYAAAGLTR